MMDFSRIIDIIASGNLVWVPRFKEEATDTFVLSISLSAYHFEIIVTLSILKRTEEILGKYQRNMLQFRVDAGHLSFFSFFFPSPSPGCFYLRRRSIFNLAWKILRFSMFARCLIVSGFSVLPLGTWENDIEASSETHAHREKERRRSKSSLVALYGASSKTHDARRSHSSAHEGEDFETAPRQFEDLPFYDRALKFNDIALTDGIILTAIFNVMSGVKFESCESQGAWSHSEQGH